LHIGPHLDHPVERTDMQTSPRPRIPTRRAAGRRRAPARPRPGPATAPTPTNGQKVKKLPSTPSDSARESYRGIGPTGRAREFDRSSRLGRKAPASAEADVDGRAERPEGGDTGRRPPQPDPDNAGAGSPPRRFTHVTGRSMPRGGEPPRGIGALRGPGHRPAPGVTDYSPRRASKRSP
jgi:hypothetical protein